MEKKQTYISLNRIPGLFKDEKEKETKFRLKTLKIETKTKQTYISNSRIITIITDCNLHFTFHTIINLITKNIAQYTSQ